MTEFDTRGGAMWGQRISITVYNPAEQICEGNGHWSPCPQVDDTFLVKSRVGTMRLRFTEVRYTLDPDDMFFFSAEPIESMEE